MSDSITPASESEQEHARERLKAGVVRCGEGRGFLVKATHDETWIITAAHCLPELPPPHPAAYLAEVTYLNFVGALDDDQRTITVECLLAEPRSDVAILAAPDNQELSDEYDAFETFVEERPHFTLDLEPDPGDVYALTLQNTWQSGSLVLPPVFRSKQTMLFTHDHIEGGMSGSPIITANGFAVSLVSCSGGSGSSWPQPIMSYCLPRWAVDAIARRATEPTR